MSESETTAVRLRYAHRKTSIETNRYSLQNPSVLQMVHERQREILKLFSKLELGDFSTIKLVEVGCGSGGNLLEFLRIGFQPENILGIELLEDRFEQASRVLPKGIVQLGDATGINIPENSQDIVFQSVVFSSLLEDSFQQLLANKMWSWLKPKGGVLWYDFIYNNPKNPDVRGVTINRIRTLFPAGKITVKRVTLAPPLARKMCQFHPSLYTILNVFPFLRTHVLCWIKKE